MVNLERSLSLWEITLMSIGIILGAGIYVVIGEAAGLSGNTIWLSFIIGALVATFSGLSYAELSSRFPSAGAEYVFIEKSFGRKLAWIVGWLIIAGNVIGGATVALGFANYFNALFQTPIFLTAIVLLILCGLILTAGVQETANVTILFTLIEAAGLAIIIAIGVSYIGKVDYLKMAQGFKGIIEGGVLIFFSYLGFQGITRLAEETENPEKNIPKAILISILVTTVIYILVGLTAISVIPWDQLAAENAPLAAIAETVFGNQSFIILSTIALFSTFNTALMMLLSGSRIIYGISKEKGLPNIFCKVSAKTLSPYIAIIAVTLGAMLVLFIGDLKSIANLTNFTVFSVFIAVNASLIYLRYKKPLTKDYTGFKVPLSIAKIPVFPVFGIITSIFMISYLSIDVLVIGIAVTIIGLVLSFVFK